MQCTQCTNAAVHNGRCTNHHVQYVEETVNKTIQNYQLFTQQDKLCVAVSGGKDSQVLLHILHQQKYNVQALLINEGIDNYRDPTIQDMQDFCNKRNIPIKTVAFTQEVGTTLDDVSKQLNAPPCTACGAWRRQLLNKHAQGFDYVVTGHNLDDEAQAHMMNILTGRVMHSARIGPKTKGNGFVKRVKPLYFLTEKDIRLYTLVKQFSVQEDDCPYAQQSFRFAVRDMLNDVEAKHSGAKMHLVQTVLGWNLQNTAPKIEKKSCTVCGQPSQRDICVACSLKQQFVKA